MRFSGTFLNSIVAKRIAIMLLLAALVPTALVTGLASGTIEKITSSHAKKELIDTSQNYGLSVFSNLIFARTALIQISEELNLRIDNNNPINTVHAPMFQSLVIASKNKLLNISGKNAYPIEALQTAIKNHPQDAQKSAIFVLPAIEKNKQPIVVIALAFNHPKVAAQTQQHFLIGEIKANYLWGDQADYPSDIQLCAYTLNKAAKKIALFCSSEQIVTQQDQAKLAKTLPTGQWSLFLRGEFEHEAWHFITKRLYVSHSSTDRFINNKRFIAIAVLSLLLVALMGLIHIRKTMIPLEKLIEGTRNIARGHFAKVDVADQSEFTELADSFNGMTDHIQRQLNTLQHLSDIDRSIATKLNVDHLIEQIIERIESFMPHPVVAVFRVAEITDSEIQCNIDISKNVRLDLTRVSISHTEYQYIQSLNQGEFSTCSTKSAFCFQKKLAHVSASHTWVYPVLWQGEMCAFISIGKNSAFDENAFYWGEIRELSNRIAIAISAQVREDRLLIQAQYDALTGLPNRILLQDRLLQAMEHSDHNGEPFWLAFIDLDRFKFVNDSLGHKAGDQLLMIVAQRLSELIQDHDTIARFGGDEFIMILQDQSDSHMRMDILNKLIQASETPIHIESKEIFMSASIGIAVYPTDGKDADSLLKNADVAMYRAKELGKNNFQFFTQSMNKRVTDRLSMETYLRKALELNEFKLVYQPKVNLQTNQIVGMEALVRWHSEVLGFVSPQQFIPLAEENGMIIPIGEWAMRTACTQTKAWQMAGFEHLRISVNLSARQFKQKNLVNAITQILDETQFDPQFLELELTESLIMSGVEESMTILHGIRSIGVQLSVDDFGTGYSSLAYLKNLPLNTLKIDKSFTDDITHSTNKVPIVDSIIQLAKNLELKVVAEGVENHDQVLYLKLNGCDEIQGYYFSKPENAENFEQMLKTNKTLLPHA